MSKPSYITQWKSGSRKRLNGVWCYLHIMKDYICSCRSLSEEIFCQLGGQFPYILNMSLGREILCCRHRTAWVRYECIEKHWCEIELQIEDECSWAIVKTEFSWAWRSPGFCRNYPRLPYLEQRCQNSSKDTSGWRSGFHNLCKQAGTTIRDNKCFFFLQFRRISYIPSIAFQQNNKHMKQDYWFCAAACNAAVASDSS